MACRTRMAANRSGLRAGLILGAFLAMTLPLMPLQLILVRTGSRFARTFPHWYHRQVCRLVGVRLHVSGQIVRPALLISNHISWLDIPVLSAVAPLSFIAKSEVGTWPLVKWLARLQRTVFVDRSRRGETGRKADEIVARLRAGDTMVLFAEGTSSDGNGVLPFRTALLAAAKPTGGARDAGLNAQTLAIAYTRLNGLPMGRWLRPHVAWYGDMDLASHGWTLLGLGPLDVKISIGPPIALAEFADRKALAAHSQAKIRRDVADMLREPVRHGAQPAPPLLDGTRAGD